MDRYDVGAEGYKTTVVFPCQGGDEVDTGVKRTDSGDRTPSGVCTAPIRTLDRVQMEG